MEAKMGYNVHGKQNGDVLNTSQGKQNGDVLTQPMQMELLLQQLKIANFPTELCPNAIPGPHSSAKEVAEARAAERRRVSDDLMCRHNILCYLSNHLFNQYANRKMTAKELWEELKQVYLNDEFGTKRSRVKRYIEFEFVEGKSIVEQAQDLSHCRLCHLCWNDD